MEEQIPKFLRHIGVVIAEAVCQGLEAYEARVRVQPFLAQQPTPVILPDGHIPAGNLAKVAMLVETLETRDFAVLVAARLFGYPESLIRSELDDYVAAQRRADVAG